MRYEVLVLASAFLVVVAVGGRFSRYRRRHLAAATVVVEIAFKEVHDGACVFESSSR